MNDTLSKLVETVSAHTDSTARQSAVRTALGTSPELDLAALEAAAVAEFDTLHAKDDAAPGALATLRQFADVVQAVRAERKERLAASAPPATAPTSTTPAAPAAPAPAPTGTAPAATAPTADTTTPAPQEAPSMDTTTAPAPGAELVTASGAGASTTTITTIKPADVAMPWESLPFDYANSPSKFVLTAAAGGGGCEAGEQFDDFGKLAKLLSSRFEALGRGMSEPSQMMLASARPEDWANAYSNIARSGIASLGFSREHDFVMQHQHDWQVIERACNEARLPGGSLTPAPGTTLTAAPGTPGWCAPCETRYDFAPPAVIDGLVDLPTVIASRGCLTYPTMPDFGLMYSTLGFQYAASAYDNPADPDPAVNGPRNKPCTMVSCPEQTTVTLDPTGVCLQSPILLERAFPELIQYFISNALVAWGHKMNCRDLQQMIAGSTVVGTAGAPIGANTGPGATASILEVIEFHATWLRYRYRLGRNASIEAVLPDWGKGVIRADLSKRSGVDLLNVTDAMIDAWLAVRKIRVQWVLGLDEAYCDLAGVPPAQIDPKTSTKFGGGTGAGNLVPPATLFPDTMSLLMYPAGTWFRARMNLVNIEGGLVDSALLKRNERLLLFVEEASVVAKRAFQSLYITVLVQASGQTGGPSQTYPAGIPAPVAPAP